ncbi:hypothetical protein [Leucobacter denitrificans]|uniref:DUF8094 domain-containing protein n=1 Tax=Leucobacter denitrificans TaxID=683042 RepID=A0A7G9S4Z8_9MICO|nr:hypothetical protein [Leucobacter denitrificans]QNN62923.1 hypothetical protein H9L06_00565 [Leucobacter denitrificans]
MRNKSRRSSRLSLICAALGLSATLMVSGCSAEYWPDFSPEPEGVEATNEPVEGNLATVPVNEAQIQTIIDRVAIAAAVGDKDLDARAIAERFSGDALTQRTANYKIRNAVSDYGSTPAVITDDLLQYQLVQSTESWPRTLFITVASEAKTDEEGNVGEAPSLALILTQRIAQENYQVSRIISLRGGIEMPQAAPAEEGTAVLSDDISGLALQPGEVGASYAAVLQGGPDVEEAALFDLSNDPLIENYGQAWVAQSQAKAEADETPQKYSVTVTQGENPITSLSTGAGGALVATTVIESQVIDSDGGRFKPRAEGAVTALSGLEGQQDRIVREVAHQLLFFVPSKQDGTQIQLLGVTSELVGAGK